MLDNAVYYVSLQQHLYRSEAKISARHLRSARNMALARRLACLWPALKCVAYKPASESHRNDGHGGTRDGSGNVSMLAAAVVSATYGRDATSASACAKILNRVW